MNFRSIISADIVQQHLHNAQWRIVDCRFNLNIPDEGFALYQMEHIPNAVYAHLDHDLSSPVTTNSGRHPLPEVEKFKQKLGNWGIDKNTQVVVYDDSAGSYAARLWWMLRWMGHDSVAVLNGGFSSWKKQGLPVTSDIPHISGTTYTGEPNMQMLVESDELQRELVHSRTFLIDVRDPNRFHGIEEPIDKVAGHIPGAINFPWKNNITGDGLYQPKALLHDQYKKIICETPGDNIVFMCGSGVTACHSLLALEYIGISGAKLYPGSWSEWISNPDRPVEPSPKLA
jgi:thiosulfate/3-mercaptopyruvate sulfurtransferase